MKRNSFIKPNERGQASIEILLVGPFLLAMMMAIFYWGYLAYYKLALQNYSYSAAMLQTRANTRVNSSSGMVENVISRIPGLSRANSLGLVSAPFGADVAPSADMTVRAPSRLQNKSGRAVLTLGQQIYDVPSWFGGPRQLASVAYGPGTPFISCKLLNPRNCLSDAAKIYWKYTDPSGLPR